METLKLKINLTNVVRKVDQIVLEKAPYDLWVETEISKVYA